jgi:integrase
VGRHGARDRTLILLAYRHALRVSELVTMRWEQIDLKAGLGKRMGMAPCGAPIFNVGA